MGLISFAKNAGQKILRRDDKDGEQQQAPAEAAGSTDGAVDQPEATSAAYSETVTWQPTVDVVADSAATLAEDITATVPAETAPASASNAGVTSGSGAERTYTTKAGDTLDVIAAYFYGDPVHRQRLLDENPGIAADGASLDEGVTLRVPEDPAPAETESATSFDSAAADAEAAQRLADLISSLGIQVQDLNVQVQGDTATLMGTAATQEDREKAVLVVGNTAGIAQVDDQLAVVTPAPEATFYEVQPGDTLSAIAQAQYGDASQYQAIFEANQPMLDNPDLIYPGQMLRIPAR